MQLRGIHTPLLPFEHLSHLRPCDFMGAIIWEVWARLAVTPDHIGKVHLDGHICHPTPSCRKTRLSKVSALQNNNNKTRESLKLPDVVTSDFGITSLWDYAFIYTYTQVFKKRTNKRKHAVIWIFISGFAFLGISGHCTPQRLDVDIIETAPEHA